VPVCLVAVNIYVNRNYKQLSVITLLRHSRLLTKLMGYGVDGQLLLWIKSFLQGRKMRVDVRGDQTE